MGPGLQDRTSVLVCRGCCCGTTRKHPTVDHDEHLRRLREAAFDGGARLWTVDCLGPCERSNVVVVRRGGVRRWLGGMLDDERIDLLAEWLRDPTACALPRSLGLHEFPSPNGAGLLRRRLLPLAGARLADRCAELLADGGTWTMGVHGAIAEFDPGEGGVEVSCVDVRPDRHIVEAVGEGAALRLVVERDTKLFAFEAPTDDRPPLSLLVRSRPVPLPVADGLAILGPDVAAIDMTAQQDRLVDLAIGRSTARFMIRTGDQELLHLLGGAVGVPFDDLDDQVVAAIVEASPTRVVETAVGRIEVGVAIPPPDGRSPDGSHTHLRRADLALGIDLPVELKIPTSWSPGATHYPKAG